MQEKPGDTPWDVYTSPYPGPIDPDRAAKCYCKRCGTVWCEPAHATVYLAGCPGHRGYICMFCKALGHRSFGTVEFYLVTFARPAPTAPPATD
jgi:hypothetical protein